MYIYVTWEEELESTSVKYKHACTPVMLMLFTVSLSQELSVCIFIINGKLPGHA